ncbi:MAG: YkgJ family cysteine cluster protein [Patescibacteria group bacterium]
MIQTLFEFYKKLDDFLSDIFVCKNCKWIRCRGYIWLLPEESEVLVNANVPIVEINGEINFVHSFPEVNNQIDFGAIKPKCLMLQDNNLCCVYQIRPLVCRLYPFGLILNKGKIKWIIHKDCEITVQIGENFDQSELCQKFLFITRELDNKLKKEIFSAYHLVNNISILPDGVPNNYHILKERR